MRMDVTEALEQENELTAVHTREDMIVARRFVACSQGLCAFSTSHSSCCEPV